MEASLPALGFLVALRAPSLRTACRAWHPSQGYWLSNSCCLHSNNSMHFVQVKFFAMYNLKSS